MKTTGLKFCALLAVTTAAATPAFANITLDAAERGVVHHNSPNTDTSHIVFTTQGAFIDNVADSGGADTTATSANANQNTDYQPLTFGGSGAAHITGHTGSPNDLNAISYLSITFTIDQNYTWITSGFVSAGVDGGTAFSYMDLTNQTLNTTVIHREAVGFGSVNLDDNGVIGPGQYTFSVLSRTNGTNGGNSFANANFEDAFLTLEPLAVPEPASLCLLVVGASALMLRRKR